MEQPKVEKQFDYDAKMGECEFVFKCPLEWKNLQKTDNPLVRFCSSCERDVYYAKDSIDANRLAIFGKCVALETNAIEPSKNDPRRGATMGFIAPPGKYSANSRFGDEWKLREKKQSKKSLWNSLSRFFLRR
ncbi:MAG: hypothetical protein H7Z37_00560, partial [Pyrinomonadaceae bacterium]|nr:hypothetical protein [Pyrinomonadaceae bacterium]